MNFFLGRRLNLKSGHDKLQLLGDHAFDFQELSLVIELELLGARHVNVMGKLFPTFEVALHLDDQAIDFFIAHDLLEAVVGPVTGARKTMAPPRSSRAVNFSAA